MMDFDYPSGKNQRFLPPPLTRGGFWCGAYRNAKLQFEVAEPNRAGVRRKLPAGQSRIASRGIPANFRSRSCGSNLRILMQS